MSLFDRYLENESSEKSKMDAMEKTIRQLEERASMRAKMRSMTLTDEEVDQYIVEDKARKAADITRKEYEESERIRVQEKNDKFIAEECKNKAYVLYVDRKRTPIKTGFKVSCPTCKKDDAFPVFTQHFIPYLIQMRDNGKYLIGRLMFGFDEAPVFCVHCQARHNFTILGVPE